MFCKRTLRKIWKAALIPPVPTRRVVKAVTTVSRVVETAVIFAISVLNSNAAKAGLETLEQKKIVPVHKTNEPIFLKLLLGKEGFFWMTCIIAIAYILKGQLVVLSKIYFC